jgi:hypothetical protein
MPHNTTDFAAGAISFPQGMPYHDRVQLALDMQAVLLADAGEAYWRELYQTYTCSTGIVSMGVN